MPVLSPNGCGTTLLSDTSLWKEGAGEEKSSTQTTGVSTILTVSILVAEKRRDEATWSLIEHVSPPRVCVPGEAENRGKCTHKLTDECMDLVFSSSLGLSHFSLCG